MFNEEVFSFPFLDQPEEQENQAEKTQTAEEALNSIFSGEDDEGIQLNPQTTLKILGLARTLDELQSIALRKVSKNSRYLGAFTRLQNLRRDFAFLIRHADLYEPKKLDKLLKLFTEQIKTLIQEFKQT